MASLTTGKCGVRPARFRHLREGTIPRGLLIFVVLLLLGVAAIPLFVSRFPPLADYPGHLAITYIIENYNRITPFQAAYTLEYGIYPNLAMDILVPPLAGILGIEASGRVFIFLILSLLFAAHCLSTRRCTVAFPSVPCSYFVYCTTGYWLGVL